MAFSAASLDELRCHLSEEDAPHVTNRNFRPNIVVAGCPPFDEDRWLQLRIGDAEFTCFKPCTRSVFSNSVIPLFPCRCILTTVNPETGAKHPDMQPLRTLREYVCVCLCECP